MELTTRGRYAVMAMADLAQHGDEAPVTLASISARQKLSLAYLEQLFGCLRRAELVNSVRGRSGGYTLARPPERIVLLDILKAVSEETKMTLCSEKTDRGCLGEKRCLTHGVWQALGLHIATFFSSITLEEVVRGGPYLPMMDAKLRFQGRVAAE